MNNCKSGIGIISLITALRYELRAGFYYINGSKKSKRSMTIHIYRDKSIMIETFIKDKDDKDILDQKVYYENRWAFNLDDLLEELTKSYGRNMSWNFYINTTSRSISPIKFKPVEGIARLWIVDPVFDEVLSISEAVLLLPEILSEKFMYSKEYKNINVIEIFYMEGYHVEIFEMINIFIKNKYAVSLVSQLKSGEWLNQIIVDENHY
jgi:hypothetical protein